MLRGQFSCHYLSSTSDFLLSPKERMVHEKNVTEKSESYGCLAARSHKLTVAVAGY